MWEELKSKGIKSYYEDDAVFLIHADCRDILPLLPDKSINLVLTDPPYGVGLQYDNYIDSRDNLSKLLDGSLKQLLRVSKRVVMTVSIGNLMLFPQPNWILSWVYRSGRGVSPWGFNCWTPILCYGKDPYLENGLGSRPDYIECADSPPAFDHPCPKPEKFWQLLLSRVSVKTSDIVLDPYLGTGTTVRVCKNMNRKSIGIDISEKYCEIAAKRCAQMVMQF